MQREPGVSGVCGEHACKEAQKPRRSFDPVRENLGRNCGRRFGLVFAGRSFTFKVSPLIFKLAGFLALPKYTSRDSPGKGLLKG